MIIVPLLYARFHRSRSEVCPGRHPSGTRVAREQRRDTRTACERHRHIMRAVYGCTMGPAMKNHVSRADDVETHMSRRWPPRVRARKVRGDLALSGTRLERLRRHERVGGAARVPRLGRGPRAEGERWLPAPCRTASRQRGGARPRLRQCGLWAWWEGGERPRRTAQAEWAAAWRSWCSWA